MPIYEYLCECGCQFEELVVSQSDVVKCGSCGCLTPQRIMSVTAPPVILGMGGTAHRFIDKHRYPMSAARYAKRPHDRGHQAKTYEMEFGSSERDKLSRKAQMDNV